MTCVTSLDVDAAGRDVGGDEDVDLAVAERAQRLLAGALAEVAVDGGGGEAALGELVGHLGGGALGAAEDDGQAAAAACSMRASISTLSIAWAR